MRSGYRVLVVLRPINDLPSAKSMMKTYYEGDDVMQFGTSCLKIIDGIDEKKRRLRAEQTVFPFAAVLLVVGVGLLAAMLTVRK